MTNTTFDNKGSTSISNQANQTGSILFQDCQFFVNTAINITSEAFSRIVYPIRMANCFISKATAHPRNMADPAIYTSTTVLVIVWNVTIHVNNTHYTSHNRDFDRYLGDNFIVSESCFLSGINSQVHMILP